jgi:hypothetical protein
MKITYGYGEKMMTPISGDVTICLLLFLYSLGIGKRR